MARAEAGAGVGEVIGGYRLDRLIAAGGMGAVFAATHVSLGRRAAVKVLAPSLASDREYVSRFLHEARIVNDVRHPNIVDIFDFVQSESPPRVALIMELLDGPTLSGALRSAGRLRASQAVELMLQLVDALGAVHRAGVVHRDLKPQNIVILAPLDGDFSVVPCAKILDFGIAKLNDHDTEHRTMTGSILGTPAYMAPEQVAAATVSPATDLYALAEILYEAIAGHPLYAGNNLQILKRKMQREAPVLGLDAATPCGPQLQALIAACLAVVPEHRPSIRDFADALLAMRDEISEVEDEDDDGARTIIADAISDDDLGSTDSTDRDLRTDPDAGAFDTGANTQMFLDRILEDFEEAPRPESPPAELSLPADEEHLTLMRAPTPYGYDAEGGAAAAPGASQRPAAPRIVQGRPAVREKRPTVPHAFAPNSVGGVGHVVGAPRRGSRAWIAVLIFAIALAGVGVSGIWVEPLRALMNPAAPEHPLRASLLEWRSKHGALAGTVEAQLEAARVAHLEDTEDGYARAEVHLQRALLMDPERADALGAYAENRLVWWGASADARAGMELILRYAEARNAGDDSVTRARALLAVGTDPGVELINRLLRRTPRDPRSSLVAAQVRAPRDPDGALVELESVPAEARRRVPIAAWALARAGRYAEAIKLLDERIAAEPKAPKLLELRAEIEAAVGRDRFAEKFFERALRAADAAIEAQSREVPGRGEKRPRPSRLGSNDVPSGRASRAPDLAPGEAGASDVARGRAPALARGEAGAGGAGPSRASAMSTSPSARALGARIALAERGARGKSPDEGIEALRAAAEAASDVPSRAAEALSKAAWAELARGRPAEALALADRAIEAMTGTSLGSTVDRPDPLGAATGEAESLAVDIAHEPVPRGPASLGAPTGTPSSHDGTSAEPASARARALGIAREPVLHGLGMAHPYASAAVARAEALFQLGKPFEARAYATSVADADPSARAILLALSGAASLSVSELLEAKQAFALAMAAAPRDPRIRVMAAASLLMLDDLAGASEHMDGLLELDPRDLNAIDPAVPFPAGPLAETEKQLAIVAADDETKRAQANALLALLALLDDRAEDAEARLESGSSGTTADLGSRGPMAPGSDRSVPDRPRSGTTANLGSGGALAPRSDPSVPDRPRSGTTADLGSRGALAPGSDGSVPDRPRSSDGKAGSQDRAGPAAGAAGEQTPLGWLVLGQLALDRGRTEQAEAALAGLQALRPNKAGTWLLQARIQAKRRRLDDARAAFDEAIAAAPALLAARLERAALDAKSRPDAVRTVIRQLHRAYPNSGAVRRYAFELGL